MTDTMCQCGLHEAHTKCPYESEKQTDESAAGLRPETTSEHIARDIREGRFPERSVPQMVAEQTDERAAFEDYYGIPAEQRRAPSAGGYASRDYQLMWGAWQACIRVRACATQQATKGEERGAYKPCNEERPCTACFTDNGPCERPSLQSLIAQADCQIGDGHVERARTTLQRAIELAHVTPSTVAGSAGQAPEIIDAIALIATAPKLTIEKKEIDYDKIVQICDAQGIDLPVEYIESVMGIIKHL